MDSGAAYHMTPEVLDFITGSLEDTDKHIGFSDENHFTAKRKGQVRIKVCNDHGYPFIATLCNV